MVKCENRKISVIVPIYKTEQYLSRCLDSICRQTYSNLEILLIDDGSPDNSGRICDEYAAKDRRISVLHKENIGVSAARNDGLELATGDYITFVDSDDYIAPKMYEILADQMETENADISICGYLQESNSGVFHINWKGKDIICLNQKEQIQCLLLNKYYTCSCCDKMFRKSVIGNTRFNANIHHYEDYLFLYEVMKKSQKVVFNPEGLYYYCNNQRSTARSPFTSRTMEIVDVCEKVMRDVIAHYPQIKKYAQVEYIRVNIMCCMYAAASESKDVRSISRLQRNIRRNLFNYLVSYAACGYKIYACLISLNWSLFRMVVR